jgi:hypothetical protein
MYCGEIGGLVCVSTDSGRADTDDAIERERMREAIVLHTRFVVHRIRLGTADVRDPYQVNYASRSMRSAVSRS